MDPAVVFKIMSVLPLPIWAVWIVAPKSRVARYFAEVLWPLVVLALCYVFALTMSVAIAPAVEGGSFSSLEGVMVLFTSEWGTLTGWVHYLCFDLFVGRWIMNDAPEAGWRLMPVLVMTMMFGPTGLLLYMLFRSKLRTVGDEMRLTVS